MQQLPKIALILMPLLSGCYGTNGPDNSFCGVAKPIYMSKQDRVSGDTARQILMHDDVGRALCGWDRV